MKSETHSQEGRSGFSRILVRGLALTVLAVSVTMIVYRCFGEKSIKDELVGNSWESASVDGFRVDFEADERFVLFAKAGAGLVYSGWYTATSDRVSLDFIWVTEEVKGDDGRIRMEKRRSSAFNSFWQLHVDAAGRKYLENEDIQGGIMTKNPAYRFYQSEKNTKHRT